MDVLIKDWVSRFSHKLRFSEFDLCDMGWYDWFERGTSHRNKFTNRCKPLIKRLLNSSLFNQDECYVFFKECLKCSNWEPIWQLKLCDTKTDNVMYCITLGEDGKGWSVWDFKSGTKYHDEEFESRALRNVRMNEVYKFFGV